MEKQVLALWGFILKIGGNMKRKIINENKLSVSKFIKKNLRTVSGVNNLFFITIRFCNEKHNLDIARESARFIMARTLFNLQGRYWFKKPCKSVFIIESGKSKRYHVHCIINTEKRDINQFKTALERVCDKCKRANLCFDFITEDEKPENFNPHKNHMHIQPVYDLNGVIDYVLKEFNWESNRINFEAFMTEKQMFNY